VQRGLTVSEFEIVDPEFSGPLHGGFHECGKRLC
jgi:hypothetical protein